MNESSRPTHSKYLKLIEAAIDLYQVGENQHALELLLKVTNQSPELDMAYLPLGLVYQAMGNPEKAEASFRRALELDIKNDRARTALGLLLIQQNQVEAGIVLLKTVLDSSPSDQDALDGLVASYQQVNQPDRAEEVLKMAWDATHKPEVGINYTRFLIIQNKIDEAYQVIQEAASYVQTPKVLIELSLLLVIRKQYHEAIETLTKVIQLDPQFDRAWRGLAHCYTQLGEVQQALECSDRALNIPNAKYPYRNWQARGDALLVAELYAEALEAAQQGIKLIDPSDPEAQPVLVVLYLQRVNAYLVKKDIDAALAELVQARKALPEEGVFYMRAIQICMQRSCVGDAIAVVEEALKSKLEPAEKWIGLGYQVFIQNGQYERALAFAKEKSEQYPSAFDILASIGVDEYTKGHINVAQIIFELLLRQFPDDLRLRTNLSYILIGEERFEQARMHLDTVLAAEADEESRGHQHIALCNLGYLSILEGDLQQAQKHFLQVINLPPSEDEAILRVAFWWDNQFVPDYAPHPIRSLPLRAAAHANLTTIALNQIDQQAAQRWASLFREEFPDLPVVGEILGTIYRASGELSYAQQALQTALEQVEDPLERQIIEGWLASLP